MDSALPVLESTHNQHLKTTNQRRFQAHSQTAPWRDIPRLKIVDVEHPFIIQNIQKGIESLGGKRNISNIVAPNSKDGVIGLYLHPEDRMSKPMMSHNVATRNVVLHITVPKRTGRGRKKGSNGPYLDPAEINEKPSARPNDSRGSDARPEKLDDNTKHLLRSLQDNEDSYEATPVGVIEHTHRFRGIPDFVYSTANSPFIKKMRENILPFRYDKIKQFAFDPSKGVQVNTDLIPPPSFSHISIPFMYSYRQNPAVKQSINSAGHLTTTNTQSAPKVSTHLVSYDVGTAPSAPPSHLPAIESLDPALQRTVTQLRDLLATRPIWTRRAITNHIGSKEYAFTLKQAFQYVGYMFRSGPWRDALVRFGLDPRTDPQYRIYQTLMFQISTRDPDPDPSTISPGKQQPHTNKKWVDERLRYAKATKGQPPNRNSHLFDGTHAALDGKVWQVCDITDPLLQSILSTSSLRPVCDIRSDGWFHNGTWAKARVIMKAKITVIREGSVPVDEDYVRLLEIPDVLDKENRKEAVLSGASRREAVLAADVRTSAASPVKRRPLGSEGAMARKRSGPGGEVGVGAVDPRVAESMREMERRGVTFESNNGVDMDMEDADGDGDRDEDEEDIDDSDEMGE